MPSSLNIAFWSPGPLELIVILAVVVLLFGNRLPKIARNMGKSLFEFKKGVKEAQQLKEELDEPIALTVDETEHEKGDTSS